MNTSRSNVRIELFRLLAACSVVFIHFVIPGKVGPVVRGMARFAVPFFFAVTGYFSFGINNRIIRNRLYKTIKLMLIATLVYLCWGCIESHYLTDVGIRLYLSRKLAIGSLARWVFLEQNPFCSHLWYLTASVYLYLIVIILTYLSNNSGKVEWCGTIRTMGIVGISIAIILDLFANGNGFKVPFTVYRNMICLGLPLFAMGLFVRSHQSVIRQNMVSSLGINGLRFLVVGGLILSAIQEIGIGKSEIPIGALISVSAIIVMADSFPVPKSSILKRLSILPLSKISTFIYIIHPLVGFALRNIITNNVMDGIIFIKSCFFPILVLLSSLVLSMLIIAIRMIRPDNRS